MTEFWTSVGVINIGLIAIAAANARRLDVRWPALYWVGMVIFAAFGDWAAYNHRAPTAVFWFYASMAGLVMSGLGVSGIPPRWPRERRRVK